MKKLIIKSWVFLVLLIISILVFHNIVRSIILKNVDFKIKEETKYVVFGHSHSETAINDSLVLSLENFSKSGESYFYIYPKVKNVINQNQNITTVFIEFTNNQIDSSMDQWIWGDKYLSSRYLVYSPFLDTKSQFTILTNNPTGFSEYFPSSFKKNFKRIFEGDFYFSEYDKLGGYNYLVMDKTDSLVKTVTSKFRSLPERNNISNTNLEYLEKIISFCKEKNKKVILFRSPQHHLSPDLKNEMRFKEILSSKFDNVDFLDFNEFPLENKEFGDFGHLNFRGAKLFSLWLDVMLNEGLLENPKKEVVVENKIKNFNSEDRETLRAYFEQKLVKNKEVLMTNIFTKGNSIELNHSFLENFQSNGLFLYSDNKYRYIAIEYSRNSSTEILEDKSFGIHGLVYDKDAHLLPSWVKSKNVNRLTWKSDYDLFEFNDKNYIILALKKDCQIEDFQQLRIFLMDKYEYKGTIGKSMEILECSFRNDQKKQMTSIRGKDANKPEPLNDAINKQFNLQKEHIFSDEFKAIDIIPFSDSSNQYIAIEYEKPFPEIFLEDKAFGVQALAFDEDFQSLPDWVKEKKGIKSLTWKSSPEKKNVNGKEYIILTLEKQCKISKWKSLRVFLMNKDEYKGTIGKPLELTNVKFEN